MVLSIGQLSKQAQVKIPTVRYYEDLGLLAKPERSEGNQRRYEYGALERLLFIKHSRELGFSIKQIISLLELQDDPNRSCAEASHIASEHLFDVQAKLAKLVALEAELQRIANDCSGQKTISSCAIMASLADHSHCAGSHT